MTYFFVAYSPMAIGMRLAARRLPYRLGRRRTLMFGLLLYIVAVLVLIPVNSGPLLIVPALIMGAGHSFSYPFLVDLAAERMPQQHRGVATSVILAAIDAGFLIGFITVGQLIKWLGFGPAFAIVAGLALAGLLYYAYMTRGSAEGGEAA